jgi:56kDa selenium binding protein (SBP56)
MVTAMKRILAAGCLASCLLASGCISTPRAAGDSELIFAWARDADEKESDFLAVIETSPKSPAFGQVLATAPVGATKTRSHHTEHEMAAGGMLFANGFGAGRTWVFDLKSPLHPKVAAEVGPSRYHHPHSFARLPNGHVLATFQMADHDNELPGGLAEIDDQGRVIRESKSAVVAGEFVRPYSLAVLPAQDRVVSTSADMHSKGVARTVQVWRLSDLKLLHSVVLPQGPRGKEGDDPAEARVLGDGRTVMVSTFNCGLYRLSGVDGDAPSARLVHDFGGGTCSLPVISGKYWVMTDTALPGLVTLDLSNPDRPRVVSRLALGRGMEPHWISLRPDGRRIVISGGLSPALEYKMLFATIDRRGQLALEPRQIDFSHLTWPHGSTGPAIPHGAVFARGD